MKNRTTLFLTCALAVCLGAKAKQVHLIPSPQQLQLQGKVVKLSRITVVAPDSLTSRLATAIVLIRKHQPGFDIQLTSSPADAAKHKAYPLAISMLPPQQLPQEGYLLETTSKGASLSASTYHGVFNGLQTLTQLIEKQGKHFTIAQVSINDYPAFATRGFMHDVGRNFQELDSLKKQLDLLALYKVNVFQWHLTDNPAWRIECKAFPQLNDARFQKKDRDTGRFYTYDEIRDLIRYAKERQIMIIPEIDVPGHSEYFKTTFGFDMASKQGMEVLETCFKEFFNEIPVEDCPLIHIGSDEVHIDNPTEFMAKMEQIVRNDRRMPLIWSPGLKGGENTILQLWGESGLRAVEKDSTLQNNPYVDSYMGYLNMFNPLIFVQRQIQHTPCNVAAGNDRALGGILCCWPDIRVAQKEKIFTQNPVWPGVLAFAERYWKGGITSEEEYINLAPTQQTEAYDKLAEFETRMVDHRNRFFANEPFLWFANLSMNWMLSNPISIKDQHKIKEIRSRLNKGEVPSELTWSKQAGASVDLKAYTQKLGVKSPDSVTVFAYTYIFSPKAQTLPCWIGFETKARSNRVSTGMPQQGEWDPNGGDLFINGVQVTPPNWENPGGFRYLKHTWHDPANEIPLEDEELFWTRKPSEIKLKKGWNLVVLDAPITYKDVMWQFTFLPLSYDDGKLSEAADLLYAPSKTK